LKLHGWPAWSAALSEMMWIFRKMAEEHHADRFSAAAWTIAAKSGTVLDQHASQKTLTAVALTLWNEAPSQSLRVVLQDQLSH
jgi:hypothetical protein